MTTDIDVSIIRPDDDIPQEHIPVSNDKPYYEGFFAVRFAVAGIEITPLTQEQYESIENLVAEVNIPFNTDEAGYTMIAMLIDMPNDHIAVSEMILLRAVVANVVNNNRDHFKLVGGSHEIPR